MLSQTNTDELAEWYQRFPGELIERFTHAFICAAEGRGIAPIANGYKPKVTNLYLANGDVGDINPAVTVIGELVSEVALDLVPDETDVTMLEIDGEWAYVQIGDVVILDRLGGAMLPQVLVKPEHVASALKDQI